MRLLPDGGEIDAPGEIQIADANAIAPGLVRTDFARALWEDPTLYRKRTKDTPLQRIGEPDEIAGAAVFLASAAGSFTTGQTIVIDGGTTTGSVVSTDDGGCPAVAAPTAGVLLPPRGTPCIVPPSNGAQASGSRCGP